MPIPATSPRSSSNRRALTLIELLAVIAIIGILAAILIPVTGRMRDSAKVAACQSNLRELGTAVYLFAGDNNDHTPPNINPEVDPPELADLSGTFVGGPGGDVRTLGWLLPEKYGGPPESPNEYLDTPAVLFCPSLSNKVYAASDEYKRPEEISRNNPIRRTGYAWIYRIERKQDAHNYGDGYFAENPNHKVTVENRNVPYAFDFGWVKGYGDQGPIISIPSHRNVINVLHLGGHITTITHDEANKHDGYDALYRFLAGDTKR
ncbi:MAG: prepilin-type N-terminal cleavage/methylation domain-containing protein [Opitutales bacterium]